LNAVEIEAQVDEYHKIHVQLPESWQASKVKVIVLENEDDLPAQTVKKRVFGQFRGQIEMSEDFDSELPDCFWLGDDK